MRINGRDVALYAGLEDASTALVGLSKSCDMQVDCDMKEFTSALSGGGKRVRPGRYSWRVNCELVVESNDTAGVTFLNAICKRKRMLVSMNIEVDGIARPQRFYGCVCVSSWKLSGAIGSAATYSVGMTGDGELITAQ